MRRSSTRYAGATAPCRDEQIPAVNEFRQLHANGHFPGLGYVKKLSMKHHIETLADFCC